MVRSKTEPSKRISKENEDESFHDPEEVRRLERELEFLRRQKARQIRKMQEERDGRRYRGPASDSDEDVPFEPRPSTRTLGKELDKAQQRFMFNVEQMEAKYMERERRGHPESLVEMDLRGNFFYPESMAGCHQQAFINRMFRHETQFGKGHLSAPHNSIDSFDGDLKAMKKCQQLDEKFGRTIRRSEERANSRRDRSSEEDITLRTESTTSRFRRRFSEDLDDDVFESGDSREKHRVSEKKDSRRHPTTSTMASFFEDKMEEDEENEFGDDEEESEEDEQSSEESEEDLEEEEAPRRRTIESKENTPESEDHMTKELSPLENQKPVTTLKNNSIVLKNKKITDYMTTRQPFTKASSEPPRMLDSSTPKNIFVLKQEATSSSISPTETVMESLEIKKNVSKEEEVETVPKEPPESSSSSNKKKSVSPQQLRKMENDSNTDSKLNESVECDKKPGGSNQLTSSDSKQKNDTEVQKSIASETPDQKKETTASPPSVKATPKVDPKIVKPVQSTPMTAAIDPKETPKIVDPNDQKPSTSRKRISKPTEKAAAAKESESHSHHHENTKKGNKGGKAKSPFCKHCEYIKEQKKQAKMDAKNGVQPKKLEDQKDSEGKKIEKTSQNKKETPKGKRVSKNTKSPCKESGASGTKRRSATVMAEEPEMKKQKLTDSDILSIPSSLAVAVDTELIAAENPSVKAENIPKFSESDAAESSIWTSVVDSKWIKDVESASKNPKGKKILGSPLSEIPKNTRMINIWVNTLLPGNMEKDPFESDYRRILAQNKKALSDGKAGYDVRQ